ncbi:MAG: hypothetical protein JSW16_07075 [Dehalococcoidales bacterium]|nr:MAG: hypothetical protein JSW16_07075 [Dehalococcoidales bacterium]
MEKEEVVASEPIIVGETTLIPIVRTFMVCRNGKEGIAGFGGKEIIGVIVISSTGHRAIDISGKEVPVDDYTSLIPKLAELLWAQ